MKIKILLLALLLLSTQGGWAQIMFQRHYGGMAEDYGCKVLQTSDGGYFVAAITESYGAGFRDIYLIRTNEQGDTIWTKTIGGNGDDQPNAMKTTFDNNYIIAGSTDSYGAGNSDMYLLKVNQNGDTLWTKTYGGAMDDQAYDVIQTSDSGYLIVGSTTSFTHGFSSVYAIRTDAYGDTVWTKTYEKCEVNTGYSSIQLSDGGFFIVGTTFMSGQVSLSDCYIIRTNISGDTVYTKTYGGPAYDGAFAVHEAGLGDIFIAGTTTSYGAGGRDIFLSQFNYDGDEIWFKTYGGTGDEYGGIFVFTGDNGFAITGYTTSFGVGNQDVYLIKTDYIGDTIWTKTFGKTGDEFGGSIQQTADNGFIISGNTTSYGNANDVFLVKTNSEGLSGFQKTIQQEIKCKVYPNPSNGNFFIEFNNPGNQKVFVRVFDYSGRLIYEKDEENNEINIYSVSLTSFSSGLYILYLYTCNDFITKRLIIQN